jgi:hypothetical protein
MAAFGIELGDGALKAVRLERRGPRLVVTAADYRPFARPEDGAARPLAGLDPRAEATLRAFLIANPPGALDRIFLGLPSVAAFNRLTRVPDVGPEQARSIAEFEIHRSLRGSVDDHVVATRLMEREGNEIPCFQFAVQRRVRDDFVTDVTRAGLEFDMLVPSPVALAQFARYDRPATGDRIVVSIGLRATEIVYLRDASYCFRTLPLGVVALAAIPESAPERRRDAAKRLVDRISYEIGAGARFHFAKTEKFQPKTVILFGEGATIPEVVAEFERHYADRLEAIGKLNRIAVSPAVRGEPLRHLAQMGSALGLAIQAARADEAEIQLLEPNLSRSAARRVPKLLALAALVALVCGALTVRDVVATDGVRALRSRDVASELRERRALGERQRAEFESSRAADEALGAWLATRAARGAVLPSLLAQFGPDIVAGGEVDCRLRELAIERTDQGAGVRGVAIARSDVASNAVHVLTQRLQNADHVGGPVVAIAPGGDAPPGYTRLEFRATTPTPGRRQ